MNLDYNCPVRIPHKSSTHSSYSSSTMATRRAGTAVTDTSAPSHVVYIVNGDLHIRQAMHNHLSSEGLNAVPFESLAEYRAVDKPDVPGCLILDVDLPDLNGFDLQRRMANTDAPIVFFTNWCDVPSWVRAIKADAVDFLTSPLLGCELLNAVHIAIATHREARSKRAEIAQLRQRFSRLTPREREVLTLVNAGLLNKQSALELGISETTLQIHRCRVMRKMAARSLADLVRMATKLAIPLPARPLTR